MKLGVVIEESQVLETHLNLRTDLTGRFAKMLSTMSCGRCSFFCRKILRGWGGSLVWDILFRIRPRKPKRLESPTKTNKLRQMNWRYIAAEEQEDADAASAERPKQERLLKMWTFCLILWVWLRKSWWGLRVRVKAKACNYGILGETDLGCVAVAVSLCVKVKRRKGKLWRWGWVNEWTI